ncbi:alpha/beta-tubulin-N-acetyltransferase 9 [Drosophila tropicalis]|uniref:alpha/beta-tubulin-N-acetyltransferase 9 n=1 Tax=Drosophila tropicalis TaxID=46794 RepID=UPI0035ABB3ED
MRLNEKTRIVGHRVILVPYEAKHVPKYHQWMSNEALRQLTASEELSLLEEYAMQRSWREDNDKLTFIVLSADLYAQSKDEIAAMVGDTNLFLHQDEDSEQTIAEAEIMIAEQDSRGKGYGREAMLLMLKYARDHLDIDKFEVKIDMDNVISQRMFQSFQFVETRRVEVFHEVTLERSITADWNKWLEEEVQLKIESY